MTRIVQGGECRSGSWAGLYARIGRSAEAFVDAPSALIETKHSLPMLVPNAPIGNDAEVQLEAS